MREKSFLEILSERLEKEIRSELSPSGNLSNSKPGPGSFDKNQEPFQIETRDSLSQDWTGLLHFDGVPRHFTGSQVLRQTYGRAASSSSASPRRPGPNEEGVKNQAWPESRKKHPLTEKQKQSIVYFWSWQIRLQEDFTESELKGAFRKLALQLHPDQNAGKTKAFIEMKAHYLCLQSVFKKD
jgi:hypothetical protein